MYNLEKLRHWLDQSKAVKKLVEERYQRPLGEALRTIRKSIGLTQVELYGELGLDVGEKKRSIREKVRHWERGDNLPNDTVIQKYLELGKAQLVSQDCGRLQDALALVGRLAGEYGQLSQAQPVRGELELRFPFIPAPDVEEIELDDGEIQSLPRYWFESSVVRVYSGESFVGELTEDGLELGGKRQVVICPSEEGITVYFPPKWSVKGLSDRWEVFKKSRRR